MLLVFPFCLTISNSCNLINEVLPDVEFDAEFEVPIDVDVPDASRVAIGNCATSSPQEDDNVRKYGNNIKSLEITNITATVDSITKNFTLVSGNITISNNTYETGWFFTNEDIYYGKTLSLDNSDGQWTTTNNILGDLNNEFTACISGEADQDSLYFRLNIVMVTDGTAEAL